MNEPQLSHVVSSRQRVSARSFQRQYPPPALVTMTWSRPFDSSCTSGVGVSAEIGGWLEVSGRTGESVSLGVLRHVRVECGGLGDPLLEEQECRLKRRIGLETPLHRSAEKHVRQRQQVHALVVRHEGAHDRAVWPRGSRAAV